VNSVVSLASNECLAEYGHACDDRGSEPNAPSATKEHPVVATEGNHACGSHTNDSSHPPNTEERPGGEVQDDRDIAQPKIRPVPIVFADVYHWLLTAIRSNNKTDDLSSP